MWKEENRRNRRKILGARTKTNQKLNTHVISGRGSSPSDSCGRRALSLATAPRRSPDLCIFLFHFICILIIFNIFILLNSASICCFFFVSTCYPVIKSVLKVLVEKITSCFHCNSRTQLLFFNFPFLAPMKCLKSIEFSLKSEAKKANIRAEKKKKYNHTRH